MEEITFIARATEGAITEDFILNQPIFIRRKYAEELSKEVEERRRDLESRQNKTKK